jgi:integrase
MGRTEGESQSARRNQRARGEGSIWQDGTTKRWWYAVSIDGKQHKYRAPDKQTAAARLKQLKVELDHGVTPGRQYRLGEHTQRWMDKVVANLKPKTQRFYRQTSEHYVLPYLGERTPMKRVSPEHIDDMLNRMRRAGYADQTVDHAYTVGRTIFEQARKWRKIMYNPFDMVDPPTVKTVEPTPLSVAEIAALRYAVEAHRLYALYELSWTLGIRKAELLGLALAGLDLKAATITISQQVLDLPGGPSIEPYTKNDKVRALPLTPRLVALIKIRIEQLLAERGEGWKEHGLLFPSERGTPMSELNLDRHFKAACVKAQIRLRDTGRRTKKDKPIFTSTLKFHHLRHTCLSWLGETDANDMVIKAIAGHADEDVTDRYVHVGVEAMRAAVLRLDRLSWRRSKAQKQRPIHRLR